MFEITRNTVSPINQFELHLFMCLLENIILHILFFIILTYLDVQMYKSTFIFLFKYS